MTLYSSDSDTVFRHGEFITVVSGLPRSGTSMMMRMLDAGGMPILTDHVRRADEDNPRGYYEFERVKKLKQDTAWLPEAMGKAVKIISFLLVELPPLYSCRVLFLRRAMPEILASQRRMMIRQGETADSVPDARMAEVYEKHLARVQTWLSAQTHLQTLYIEHKQVIECPYQVASQVNAFLGGGLDTHAMGKAVDPELYRQRMGGNSQETK
ncbi:MAG TPA: sulfotransferase family protein [Candidatus Hydrogenedentes bacterium]|nr:sulfotransferase family protein [Candidatus Hydrogenedentota bacterium]